MEIFCREAIDRDRLRALFLHIPKTGGVSLFHAFAQNGRRVLHYEEGGAVGNTLTETLETLKREPIDLIGGHLEYGVHRDLGLSLKEWRYLTILRHPVDRVASFYRYVKARPDHPDYPAVAGDRGICGMMEARIPQLNDGAVRVLCGAMHGHCHPVMPFGAVEEQHYQEAMENLQRDFLAVGLQEQLGQFVEELYRIGFLEGQVLPRMNRSETGAPVSEEERAAILNANQWDLALYEAFDLKQASASGAGGQAGS